MNAEEQKAYDKQYYQDNKELINARNKQYYQDNKERIAAQRKEWKQNNREQHNIYRRGIFKFKMQGAISRILHKNQKTSIYTPYFGCSCDEFREHIAQLCLQKNTTLENFRAADFTIDHVVPFDAFDAIDDEQNLDCEWQRQTVSHYTNLQLLTMSENSSKGTSYTQKDYDLLVARVKCLSKLDECLSVF